MEHAKGFPAELRTRWRADGHTTLALGAQGVKLEAMWKRCRVTRQQRLLQVSPTLPPAPELLNMAQEMLHKRQLEQSRRPHSRGQAGPRWAEQLQSEEDALHPHGPFSN